MGTMKAMSKQWFPGLILQLHMRSFMPCFWVVASLCTEMIKINSGEATRLTDNLPSKVALLTLVRLHRRLRRISRFSIRGLYLLDKALVVPIIPSAFVV
ncbi:hypothetical protein N431DRAFT_221079 [Stipitochalara longipes BDJ]|nr:hypothetical protein N431DRAFT_221079 [Stipitochalara longipes BDJ]